MFEINLLCRSIYGGDFEDENFSLRHTGPGEILRHTGQGEILRPTGPGQKPARVATFFNPPPTPSSFLETKFLSYSCETFRHPVDGKCWSKHKRISVLHLHGSNFIPRWETRCLWLRRCRDGNGGKFKIKLNQNK